MAFWNKKKKDEEESAQPSSSTDSAPTSRAARAVRDLFNATVQGTQKAVQADQAVAQAGQRKLADAAQNLYAATVRGQQAAVRADQAVAQAGQQKLADAAQGLYSAYQKQQETAARQQMARQAEQMQAPTRRAQDAAAGLYSAYLNQQQSGMPTIQAPTPRAASAASALLNIGTQRKQNSAPAQHGNLSVDPASRGRVLNPDGTYSTVDTFSREEDGMEVLVPSVIKVNGQWKHVDEDTAWQHYLQTGENFGKFRTPEEADAYARQLHEYHEDYYADQDDNSVQENELRRLQADMDVNMVNNQRVQGALRAMLAAQTQQQEDSLRLQEEQNEIKKQVLTADRLKDVGSAALTGSTAGYTGTARALYESGQNARNTQNRELLEEYERNLIRAKADYEYYLEQAGGNVNDSDVVSQRYIVEDWQRKYDAMAKVVNEQVQQKATQAATELTKELEAKTQESTEKAKEGLGTVGSFAVDAAINMLEMSMDAVAGTATGGNNLIPMALRVFGQSASKAQQQGASIDRQLGYATATAGIEVMTEMMFDGLAGLYGAGAADEVTEAVIRKLAKTDTGRSALRLLLSMNEEGIEEVVSDALSPIAETIITGDGIAESYRKNFDISETMYNYLVGAAVAGAMNMARPVSAMRGNVESNETLASVDAAEQAYKELGVDEKEAGTLAWATVKTINGEELNAREQRAFDGSDVAHHVVEIMSGKQAEEQAPTARAEEAAQAMLDQGNTNVRAAAETAEREQSWQERVAAAWDRMEAEQGDTNYDEDAAFIDTSGNPVLWNTTDQRHAALLNGSGGLNAAINDGYIRIKQGEGIELAIDNGVLSPQQAQAIRKLVDGFTGNAFRVDMDVQAGDRTQTIGALSFEGADIDGRRIVDAINREIRRNAQQTNENAPAAAEAGAESTSVNTDPSAHTRTEQRIIEDYRASTDTDLVDFVQEVLAAPGDEANGDTFGLNPVSDRAVQDIKRITGVNTTGYSTAIQGSMVKHIYHDHGPNGISDHSMSDINDIGRIQYVLDNYDSAEKGKGTKAYRTNKPNGGQGPAQTVVFRKAVNGTYYVVEAVPDTRAKTAYIVTAYMEKNRTGTEYAPDANAPSRTAETEGTQSPVYDNSINHSGENGNTENAERAPGLTLATEAGTIDGKAYEAVDESKLTKSQRNIIEATQAIAEALGLDVTVVNARGDLGGAYMGGGKIYLNIASGMNLSNFSKAIGSASMSHELTHWMDEYAHDDFEALKRITIGSMSEEQLNTLVREQMAMQPGLTEPEALDEVVANACQPLLKDSKAFEQLARQDMSLAERILDFIKQFATRIREAFADVDFNDNIPVFHAVQAVEDHISEMQEAFDKALLAARENMATRSTETDATDEALRNSTPRFQMNGEVEATDQLVAVHNKSISGLRRMLRRGGIPFPSIAIKKAGTSHEGFGDVSIVFPRSTIDPQEDRQNRLYSNDAWTPTEPPTEYEVDIPYKLKNKIAESVGEEIFSALNGYSYLDDGEVAKGLMNAQGDLFDALKGRSVVKYAYLKSIGQDPKVPGRAERLDGFGKYKNEQLMAIFDALMPSEIENLSYENGDDQRIADILNEQFRSQFKGNETKFKALLNKPLYSADKVSLNAIKDAWRKYTENGRSIHMEPDSQALDQLLRDNKDIENDPGFREWVEQTFGNTVKGSGIPNGKDPYTSSGNRRSFKQTHVPATLENIVAQMRKENEKGIGVMGINLRGAATKTYNSVEEMRADSGKLLGTRISDDEYDSYMSEFHGRLHEITRQASPSERWETQDSTQEILLETLRDAKTKEQMDRMLKKEAQWINLYDGLTDQLWQLKQDVQDMPAPYFEAKPRRIVYPEEALAYILPDNAGQDIRNELERRGFNVMLYKAGDEADRLQKLNSVPKARFQTWEGLADGGDIRRQLADAEREYMEHSDANDAEYDYRAQLEKINNLRRQIEEAESVNAEADNVNAETDTNPTIEALEREGRVSRGTYDVEKYGDTHPERGEVGRDGVRMCNTIEDLEAELNEVGGAKIRNDTGEYFARIRRKNDNGYLLTINRDGKRDISRSFGNFEEASAYAASYIEGQTQARTDAELDNEKSTPVPRQEPIEATVTGNVQDEAKRQKQNKAAEASTQSLRDRIRKTDEEIKALRRLEKTTGLTELQAQHKADLKETLEILNDELTSRKGRAKAKKEKVEVKGNKPVRSAAEAKNRLMEIFHTAPGQRADTNTKLEAKLAEIVSSGKITEQNREDILDMLIDAGMVRQEAEQEYRDVRDWLRGSRIYVSEHDRADFGDDWEGIRKSAWANGIYLTSNESDRSVDSLVSELAETFGTNMFPTDDAPSDMVRNLIEQAEKGRSSMITFAEAVNNEARMEHVDPQEIWNDLARQTDETLRAFAEKAKLEMDLKDRTASMLATERKRAEDRMERMAQRRRESEIREKTFKAIRRLKKLRGKAAADVKTQIDEAIRDIDTQARQLTINGLEDLQELARVYEDAKKAAGYVDEENPGNFLKNPYIEERLNRLTQKHINEMDIDDVIELGRVVAALENTVKTNGKMIGEQFDSEVKTVADKVNAEVQSSRGAKPGFLQKWFAEEQLSPRRFLELLGGWKKGAMANLADSLEKGQTKMLDFQRRAAQLMDPFMNKKENRKWLKTASGKNAKWYTYSVANGLDAEGGGITGQTIEITPMMKVSLYLASLNEDNLRHIQTGGLVIPDKALYMKGKTQEAFAQGKRVKMQPEAVRHIAASLTQEEKTFAGYLQKFFNTMSKDAINEVSVQLDGFERADVEQYFPIESSRAFLKSDVSGEARAQTVEGIGSIANERVHASNPIVLDDAYNVFMRQVDKVSRYYGYAIPIRNFQAVNNFVFHEEGNAFAGSIKDTINRKWGAGAENYITKMLADIQGASSKGDMTSRFLSMLRGNLAGATLAVNPSVAVSQTASYPGAAQAVGWDGLAAGLVSGPVDEKLIEKYTPLLWYRSQGYSTQEIGDAVSAQNKSLAQKALASKALNWIQTMDRLAVKRIWKAAEYRVTKDTGLKPGSKALIDSGMDPYYQKVAEVFNRAVYDTQPNYTDMERAQILRSDSDITKFLTMYKTVPLQYYGMTAEAVGRMQAALKSGNKTEIRAARKYAADTFGGLLAANSVYVVMKALFKSFRGKDKDYRDEEGEITPESYFKQLGKDLAETYAGSIIGGAEAYSLITGWINGDKFRAPEINVLSSVEDIANGFQSIFKAIDDDDPGKTAKAVKDAAENIAMVCGLPVKNVETYLMAAIRYIQPQTAMQYDSFFGGLNKGDLKGMDSDTIGSAASIIMNSRTGANMERAATDELSRLYAAGYTDAIPTAIPDSFEYAGNTVKIKDRGAYRETWGGTVGDNLEELTANESYINADDKTKEAMIRKLYQYATVQARMGADPAYTVEGNSTYGWTEKADAAMESGMDLPTVIAAMTTMNAMTADKVNGQTVKSKKTKVVEYIDSLKLDTEQKDALYELAGYESGLEKAPWHSGISAEAGYTTGTNKPVINETARKRAVEANYQKLTSSAAYKAADDQTKKAMIEKLNQYAEVQGMVTTDPDYLPTGTAGWTIWAETAEKAGIDLISAIDYATQLDSFKADYNEYGKAISGSKKDKVTKYIDALDLTNEQKDILYLKIYAENSLKYTPWHGYTGKKKTRSGGGRRGSGKKSTAAKKPVSVGKITPKYDTGIDISKLFGTTSTKSGTGKKSGLATDLAEIVNEGLDISELFKYTLTQKAPKGRTSVDFKL